MNNIIKSFIKYGIPSKLAEIIAAKSLTITSLKATSNKVLTSTFDLSKEEAKFLKTQIKRQPIDNLVVDKLLIRSNFTCSCCHGVKGKTFIIHHIEEYHTSQNNHIKNLVVLCPICHDLAHAKRSLTLNITKSQLRRAKRNWERLCKKSSIGLAAKESKIIFETWQVMIDDDENTQTLLDLTIRKTSIRVYGHFQLINISRGNTFLAGEFHHPIGLMDADVKLSYWEMQWGIRMSLKRSSHLIIIYLNNEKLLLRDLGRLFTDAPLLELYQPRPFETWAANITGKSTDS